MIKGTILAISLAIFVTSLIFFLSGVSGTLQENILTGAAIGPVTITNYSLAGMFISGLIVMLIIFRMRK